MEELQESGGAFTMLFSRSPLPQAIMSRQGVYLNVNDAYCSLHGVERNELIGNTPCHVGFASSGELQRILGLFEEYHNRLDGYVLKYPTRKIPLLYVRIFAHSIQLNGSDAILMVLDDITHQRLAEKAVKESERFLQTILNSIPSRVFWKDRNSVIRGANQLVAKDAGLASADELIGKTDYDLFDKAVADKFVADDLNIINNDKGILFYEEKQPLSDGIHWRMISKVPLKNSQGKIIGILGAYDDITARRRAEADLKRARFSIDQATSSIIWILKDGSFVDFNPAFCELLQYTRQELLKLKVSDIDPLYNVDEWPRHWENLKQQQSLTFTTRQIRKDGKVLDVEVQAHYIEFEGEEFNCAFINDISARKQIHEELQNSYRFQQAVLNNIPSGVFWKDRNLNYLGINSFVKKIANYQTDEEVIGKSDFDFPWRAQAEQLREDDRFVIDNNISKINYIETLEDAQGKIHYNEVSKVPLIDDEGNVIGVLGTFRDVTEQRETELALKKSEKLLKGVVQNASAIIYILDRQGMFQLSEGLGLAALGLKPGQVIGLSVFEMYKDFPEITDPIRKALEGKAIENEVSVGGLTFSSRFTPLQDENGSITGLLCVSFDITSRKKMEDELNRLNNELEHRVIKRTEQLQQANQDLEAFAYSVSHDLRAPIRHINGFAKLMFNAIESPTEIVSRHYQRIIDSSKRMARMVDDLLSFARLGKKPITKTIVNLDAIINGVISIYKLEPNNSKIEWKLGSLGALNGDGGLLQLVFENLLSNAIKYSMVRELPIVEISGVRTDSQLEISIKDNGVGFDMAYADKLFGVFQRLHGHEEFEGTGIGLANVRQIVLKHNGSIRAEGKVNEGAVFYVTFPLT